MPLPSAIPHLLCPCCLLLWALYPPRSSRHSGECKRSITQGSWSGPCSFDGEPRQCAWKNVTMLWKFKHSYKILKTVHRWVIQTHIRHFGKEHHGEEKWHLLTNWLPSWENIRLLYICHSTVILWSRFKQIWGTHVSANCTWSYTPVNGGVATQDWSAWPQIHSSSTIKCCLYHFLW